MGSPRGTIIQEYPGFFNSMAWRRKKAQVAQVSKSIPRKRNMSNADRFNTDNEEYVKHFGHKVRPVSPHQRPITKPRPAGIALTLSWKEVGCSYLHGRPYGVGAVGLSVLTELY